MAFDIDIGATAQPDTGFDIVIDADVGTAIDDTGYRLVRIPGGHTFLIRSPLRSPAWITEELAFIPSFGLDDASGYYYSNPDPGFAFIVRQPHGWYEELLPESIAPPDPPGPTLTAWQAGNFAGKWVAAIEGYENLLTDDGDTDAVETAWSGTGYTSSINGLFVRCNPSQSINPWNPFENSGGSLTLQVVGDQFGIDTHLKSGGAEAFASTSIDCDDTSVGALSTFSFASPSGTAYIGTEAIGYSANTGTSLTGLTRGKYSPFLTEGDDNFAHPHTITVDDPTTVAIPSVVSSTPRQWVGKWVGLWRHVERQGLLNVKDDALCTFAGRISEIRDNPQTMTTDVEVTHVLDYIRDAVLGENPWKATIEEGITLAPGMVFDAEDSTATPFALLTATQLVVVDASPTGSYEVLAGRYSLTQIIGILNAWLDAALTDGDLHGTYSFRLNADADGVTHGKFTYQMTSGTFHNVKIEMPPGIMRALGGFDGVSAAANGNSQLDKSWMDAAFEYVISTGPALRSVIMASLNDIGVGVTIDLVDIFGEFFDQAASLPASLLALLPSSASGGQIGICMLNDTQPVIVSVGIGGDNLIGLTGFDPVTGALVPAAGDILFDDAQPLKLRQIYVLRDTAANILLKILLSTGTTDFNHATYDKHPAIIGLGIPFGMCPNLVDSVLALNHADDELTIIIDRPKKLVDIIGADLKFLFAFPRWLSGSLEFHQWRTPTTGVALEESNKASPAGNVDEQRSVSVLSDKWTRNVVKVDYNRDFTVADTGSVDFHSHVTIIDRAGIDDAGGQKKTETIPLATRYTDSFLGGSGSLQATIDDFRSTVQLFTRPVRTSKRTIAPTMFEGLSVGDCVLVTDAFARDPDTGRRGVSTRPGIIVSHSYEDGGFEPGGTVADMHGDVEIMFLDLLRVGPYVPAANVASVSGADITLSAHACSDTSEAVDATWMSAGRKVRIVERDPANPASPLSWDRTVSSVAGNVVTLTASLSSPTYDAALSYRMIWDDYGDAVAAQQAYSYQADDADYQIADSRAPYQYTTGTGLDGWLTGDANSASDPVELPPDSSYGDGVGYDVGHQQALNRLANNLYDYKTATSTPILFSSAITVTKNGDAWEAVLIYPIYLGADTISSLVTRKLYVAPMFKSSNGTSIEARITLSKLPPTGGNDFLDVAFAIPNASASFSTTSTTYTTPTAVGISFGQLKDLYGVVYLTLEMKVPDLIVTASCRGVAVSYAGPRE